jgi:hypothetical protein
MQNGKNIGKTKTEREAKIFVRHHARDKNTIFLPQDS